MSQLRLPLAGVMVLVAGCGDASAPNGPQGSYLLERVNGGALPFVAEQSGTFRIDIISGSLVLRPDHSFGGEITSRQTQGSTAVLFVEQSAGSWSSSGASITFSETGGGAFTGTISADGLTALRSGVSFKFMRE